MILRLSGRPVAACVVALYALVVGVLLPLHLLAEAAEPGDRGSGGSAFVARCLDRGCHEPTHHHRSGHAHDAATCANCSKAKAAVTPAPAVSAAVATLEVLGRVRAAVRTAPFAAIPGLPSARGPPSLLS